MLPQVNKEKFNEFIRWLRVLSLYSGQPNLIKQAFNQYDKDMQDFIYVMTKTLHNNIQDFIKEPE